MRVAIVGVCGSGKTTVANGLKAVGVDAYVVGQEHSIVADLWRRQNPDAVIYLEASLDTVRERRGASWPGWIFELQQNRLRGARNAADIIVDTGSTSVPETIDEIRRSLESFPTPDGDLADADR
jgi:adenylate kinase family enzyme